MALPKSLSFLKRHSQAKMAPDRGHEKARPPPLKLHREEKPLARTFYVFLHRWVGLAITGFCPRGGVGGRRVLKDETMNEPQSGDARDSGPNYAAVWRWHFYAGLFCLPFFCWLAITGSIYLFRPDIEAWLDRPYETLHLDRPRAAPSAEAGAAVAAVPGSVFSRYEPPATPTGAARVIVARDGRLLRVYVHPGTLRAMSIEQDDHRLMELVAHLHGNLLLGDLGSNLVELAGSWGIIMILTGLYLWLPRGTGLLGWIALIPGSASVAGCSGATFTRSRACGLDIVDAVPVAQRIALVGELGELPDLGAQPLGGDCWHARLADRRQGATGPAHPRVRIAYHAEKRHAGNDGSRDGRDVGPHRAGGPTQGADRPGFAGSRHGGARRCTTRRA